MKNKSWGMRLALASLVPLGAVAAPPPASAATPGACAVVSSSSCEMVAAGAVGAVEYTIVSPGSAYIWVDNVGGPGCVTGNVYSAFYIGQGAAGAAPLFLQPLCTYRLTVSAFGGVVAASLA